MLCLARGLLSLKKPWFSCSRGLPRPPLGTFCKPIWLIWAKKCTLSKGKVKPGDTFWTAVFFLVFCPALPGSSQDAQTHGFSYFCMLFLVLGFLNLQKPMVFHAFSWPGPPQPSKTNGFYAFSCPGPPQPQKNNGFLCSRKLPRPPLCPFWEQPSETRKTHPRDFPASLEYPTPCPAQKVLIHVSALTISRRPGASRPKPEKNPTVRARLH